MKIFLRKAIIFLLPITLVAVPCIITLFYAGELYDKDAIKPLKKNQLIGLAYTETNEQYKFAMSQRFSSLDVLALGSSRIMEVKKPVINDSLSFYNAGGAVNNIYQFRYFLGKLPYSPKLLIINIDQFFFNSKFKNQKESFDESCYDYHRDNIAALCGNLIVDICKGKIKFDKVFDAENENIGLNAKINENGFTYDGSYNYGQVTNNPSSCPDYNFRDTFKRIETGTQGFEYCDEADSSVVSEMDVFLTECERRNISVLAIIPPFAPVVLKKMREMGKYHYLDQLFGLLAPCFSKYNHCYLYDYTDMSSMDVNNYEFIDGFHGSELTYNMILKEITAKNKHLKPYFVTEKEFGYFIKTYKSKQIRFHQ